MLFYTIASQHGQAAGKVKAELNSQLLTCLQAMQQNEAAELVLIVTVLRPQL